MITENNIESLRRKDVFKVPDNYFDTLTDRIMANIPEGKDNGKAAGINVNRSSKIIALWVGITSSVAAAVIALVMVNSGIITDGQSEVNDALAKAENAEIKAESLMTEINEEAMTYSMIDEHDIYSYLSGDTEAGL